MVGTVCSPRDEGACALQLRVLSHKQSLRDVTIKLGYGEDRGVCLLEREGWKVDPGSSQAQYSLCSEGICRFVGVCASPAAPMVAQRP